MTVSESHAYSPGTNGARAPVPARSWPPLGALLLLAGPRIFRLVLFPLCYPVFMVPLPSILFYAVMFPLQRLAAEQAAWALDLLRGLPSTSLIDRTSRVVGQAVGARDWTSSSAKALVRSLLAPVAVRQ